MPNRRVKFTQVSSCKNNSQESVVHAIDEKGGIWHYCKEWTQLSSPEIGEDGKHDTTAKDARLKTEVQRLKEEEEMYRVKCEEREKAFQKRMKKQDEEDKKELEAAGARRKEREDNEPTLGKRLAGMFK